jgi:peptide chain release factor 2
MCQSDLATLEKMVDVSRMQTRLEEIDARLGQSDLWDNPVSAAALMKERKKLADLSELLVRARNEVGFYGELVECGDFDKRDIAQLLQLHTDLKPIILQQMMQDPADSTPAILSINAGAGGTEAANWVTMLLRMYLRYASNHGFSTEILDEKPSEEHSSICTDSVSIRIEGPYAYGFFKGESGVHRLIRNSPFNAANARQTSFAAVQVTPDIEDTIDIKVEEKDIDITAQTAGGPGGQNQNKVASAIRLKHIPTGINILVRTERDQLSNRKTAMKMLKAKLYQMEVQKKKEEQDKHIAALTDISFGHQIRTYTESPQAMVVDHRTGHKVQQFDLVLDGSIHDFMVAYLQSHKTA